MGFTEKALEWVTDPIGAASSYCGSVTMITLAMLALASLPMLLSWMTVETTGASDQDGVKEDTQPAIKKDMTLAELKGYTGKDGSEPVLVAIKGCIYDVTAGKDFYGEGGPYNIFAGIDASRALAKMSFKPEDLNGNISDLSASEKDVLHDWEQKFQMKYKRVGNVIQG